MQFPQAVSTVFAQQRCAQDSTPHALARRLAVPLGTAPVTGMGLLVNGGYGLLSRKYGATCENILGLTLVNADGDVVGGQGGRPRCSCPAAAKACN